MRGQGHSDPKIKCDNLRPYPHTNLINIGDDFSRTEIRGQGYSDLETVFDISASNNKRYAPYTIFLELKTDVKVIVTLKQYATPHSPKIYPHIK